MSILKELVSGVTKKFEVFETFFHNKQKNIDYKTRLNDDEVEDVAYLHTLHDYMKTNWMYNSPINNYLERKKALRVSMDGLGRKEMMEILKNEVIHDEENDRRKGSWEKLTGQ